MSSHKKAKRQGPSKKPKIKDGKYRPLNETDNVADYEKDEN